MEENKPHMSSVMRSSMEASRWGKMLLQNNTNKFSQTKTKFCSNRIHSKGHSERSQDFSSKRCAFINENHLKSQVNYYVKKFSIKCIIVVVITYGIVFEWYSVDLFHKSDKHNSKNFELNKIENTIKLLIMF